MRTKKKLKGNFNQTLAPLLFLSPNIIIFGLFIVVPAILGLRMSLYQWSIFGEPVFIGLKNFTELFSDSMFWLTLKNTLIYVFLTVPLLLVVSLLLGLLTAHRLPGIGIFRALYYVPAMLSLIIVGISWRWILGEEMGILNYLLKVAGGMPVHWLTTDTMAKLSLVMVTVWATAGFYMVMFIAGLQAIPDDLYAAASIDGASKWQTFFRITLPLLRTTVLVVLVLSTINAFKAFELIFVMTGGGPGYATKFLVQNIYLVAFEQDRMGYAAANSIILLAIIGLLTMIQFRMTRGELAGE
ncbi:Melibiose/raffinose/stachyose import permease protein MelD [subsurface metagenome]